MNGNGACYAASGPLRIHWDKVTSGERGSDVLGAIRKLPEGQLWRHNQSGDLQGDGDKLDTRALAELVRANKGKRGFTYTHKPLRSVAERAAVKKANAQGFTVNLSANNLVHADALADLAIAPVVVLLPADQTTNTVTPKNRTVIVCPATQRDNISCKTCQLCARPRDVIVGFPAHGTGAKKVSIIARSH